MKISIVVPVYNESESLPHLIERLHQVLDGQAFQWEVVLADDGSSDGSAEVLERMAAQDEAHVRAVLFRRNYGQTAAMAAGIEHAVGDVIVLMDADLQNDPADIPMLLEKLDEGYDVVSGWRKDRQDSLFLRTLPSRIANRLIGRVTGVVLHDYGCSLKAYKREIIKGFTLYGEMHRFIPAYARAVGARIAEVPVRHHARKYGKTKYGLGRTVRVILDLMTVRFLTGFASKPMHYLGRPGLISLALAAVALCCAFVIPFVLNAKAAFWPLLALSVFLAGMGFQAIALGLVAELLMRTYHESQGKTPYTIKRRINVDKPDEVAALAE